MELGLERVDDQLLVGFLSSLGGLLVARLGGWLCVCFCATGLGGVRGFRCRFLVVGLRVGRGGWFVDGGGTAYADLGLDLFHRARADSLNFLQIIDGFEGTVLGPVVDNLLGTTRADALEGDQLVLGRSIDIYRGHGDAVDGEPHGENQQEFLHKFLPFVLTVSRLIAG